MFDAPGASAAPPLGDRFGRGHDYLRVSLTDRCNLRCRYCRPAKDTTGLAGREILTEAEIVRLARIFVAAGVRKIRLTGGEPTLRAGLEAITAKLVALPGLDTLALTTNGVLLRDRAAALRASGVCAINFSLDSLRPERFAAIAGRSALLDVRAGIDAALATGFPTVKVNVVVVAGVNDDELLDFVELARSRPLNVRFIEYMPFKDNGWDAERLVPWAELRDRVAARHRLRTVAAPASAVARDFAIPGHRGLVSFIAPLTAPFCDRCSRLRLTADGGLKTCLFRPAAVGLRDPLRAGATDAELAALIAGAVRAKPAARPPLDRLAESVAHAMFEIGG